MEEPFPNAPTEDFVVLHRQETAAFTRASAASMPGTRPAPDGMSTTTARGLRKTTSRASSPLPQFNFNPSATSPDADDGMLSTGVPSRSVGHHRGCSGVHGASLEAADPLRSISPSKSPESFAESQDLLQPPPGARRHAHRRSGAMSFHDLSSLMDPGGAKSPANPGSAPTSPLPRSSKPTSTSSADCSPFGSPQRSDADVGPFRLSGSPIRRPEARGIRFAEAVEYIPRPLSTMSSGTGSSMSTVRGHSLSGSFSSFMGSGAGSPASVHMNRSPLSPNLERGYARSLSSPAVVKASQSQESQSQHGSGSPEADRVICGRPTLGPAIAFEVPVETNTSDLPPNLEADGYPYLCADRGTSEPTLLVEPAQQQYLQSLTHNSANIDASSQVTLQTTRSLPDELSGASEPHQPGKQNRIRSWASALLSRRPRNGSPMRADVRSRSQSRDLEHREADIPKAAEADDGDFGPNFDVENTVVMKSAPSSPWYQQDTISTARPSMKPRSLSTPALEVVKPIIDLDDALNPSTSPSQWPELQLSTRRGFPVSRRTLHSSGLIGPGMHYHRRAESAPASPLTEYPLTKLQRFAANSAIDDVYEEEDEEAVGNARNAANAANGFTNGFSIADVLGISAPIVYAQGGPLSAIDGPSEDDSIVADTAQIQDGRTAITGNHVETFMPSSDDGKSAEILPAFGQLGEETTAGRPSKLRSLSWTNSPATAIAASPTYSQNKTAPWQMTPATGTASTFSSPDFNRQVSFETPRISTAASSYTDTRTLNSVSAGEPGPAVRMSGEDVPSLTSSRSTRTSTVQSQFPSISSRSTGQPSGASAGSRSALEQRKKRASIASLSKLVSGSFSERSTTPVERAQTSGLEIDGQVKEKKESRLGRMMRFWKSRKSPRASED